MFGESIFQKMSDIILGHTVKELGVGERGRHVAAPSKTKEIEQDNKNIAKTELKVRIAILVQLIVKQFTSNDEETDTFIIFFIFKQ